MSSVYGYRPKFARRRDGDDRARPGETVCDHMGCGRAGLHRAPKSRERINEYWHFCQEHASAYNKRWNYFAGMSDSELDAFQKQAELGHRPTWSFRAAKNDQVSAAFRNFQGGRRQDAFNLFGQGAAQTRAERRRARGLSRLQTLALEALALEETATAAEIRARYAELVKRYHPDANGGDRSNEADLNRVIRAYQTLKSAGLA